MFCGLNWLTLSAARASDHPSLEGWLKQKDQLNFTDNISQA